MGEPVLIAARIATLSAPMIAIRENDKSVDVATMARISVRNVEMNVWTALTTCTRHDSGRPSHERLNDAEILLNIVFY